ncbi:unnamed protein product, partial [marine sediment metagenome]
MLITKGYFYNRESHVNCQALKDAWVTLLSRYHWDWFCTFTFRGEILHPEKASKTFDTLLCKINRALFGR